MQFPRLATCCALLHRQPGVGESPADNHRLQAAVQVTVQATDYRLQGATLLQDLHSTLHTIHSTFLTLQCLHSTLYFAQSTMDLAKCTLPSVHSKVYSAKFSLHNYCRVFTIISPVVAWITDDNYSGTMYTCKLTTFYM